MKISDRAIKVIFALIACWIAIASCFWIVGNDMFVDADPILVEILQEVMLMTSIALGAIFLLILGSVYKLSTTMGKVWMFLGIGMMLWLIGEFLITYYDTSVYALLDPGDVPNYGIYDLFYISAYPFLAVGLLIQMRLLKMSTSSKEKVGIAIAIVVSSVIIFWISLLPMIVAWGTSADIIGDIVLALYPVLDMFLIACVIIVFAKLRKGKINIAWILILIGFVVMTVADTVYQIYQQAEIEVLFAPFDLMYLISYLLIFAGALKVINVMTASSKS
jgi:hypothetical protein